MDEQPITITERAAEQIGQILVDQDEQFLGLRVFVSGGGCSGFQYGFTFAEDHQEGDTVIETGGITVYVDFMSIQYLQGSTIDFKKDIDGEQFTIDNPTAQTTCGCGSSFGI